MKKANHFDRRIVILVHVLVMELYKRFPKLCLIWCSIEVAMYAGQLFGWSALMYILKDEGFYAEYCETNVTTDNVPDCTVSIVELPERLCMGNNSNRNYLLAEFDKNRTLTSDKIILRTLENNTSAMNSKHQNEIQHKTVNTVADINNSLSSQRYINIPGQYLEKCAIQDSRLNLWFSIGVGFSYVMCGILGPLMRRMGMRLYRLFFLAVYVIGALCIGFATKALSWLLCPGLCCIGIAGMALYASNLQVSFLFIKIQSTITSVLVGLFDFSTITQQIVKIAYANNISRKGSFIFLAGLHIAMVGISTLVLLPAVRYELPSPKTKTKVNKSYNETEEELEGFITDNEYNETSSEHALKASPKLSELMFSSQYLLHLYWMTIMSLRFVSFIGFLNSWMTTLFMGNTVKETYYLGVFSYTTMGTAFTAITAGLLHDSQRWKYASECDYRRTHLPIIVPLAVNILFSVLCTVLSFVRLEGFLYVTFILFTIFRSYLFSYEVTFINDAFPLIHFTQLFGILQLFAGIGSLLQYGLFEWFQAYEIAPTHINIVLIVLEVSTLAHPINIWYRSRRHRCTQDTSIRKQSTDIEI